MALASVNSGTTAALTVGTETTLNVTMTIAGTYVLLLDLTPLANGDILEVRVYNRTLATDTGNGVLAWYGAYSNAQAEPQVITTPVPAIAACTFTVNQAAGVGRQFKFNILTL